mgnify:FL=1
MKKLSALLLAAVLCLSLAACGKASEASSEPSAEPTEGAYTDVEACAGYAIEKLKTVLKNPASLQVNSLSAVATDDSYIYAVDYSSFGGMNRSNLYLDVYLCFKVCTNERRSKNIRIAVENQLKEG